MSGVLASGAKSRYAVGLTSRRRSTCFWPEPASPFGRAMAVSSSSHSSSTAAAMSTLEDLEQQVRSETRTASAATGVNILLPQHFVSIVRGRPHVRNTGVSRECKIEMLTRNPPGNGGPAAVFGCRAVGWFDAREVALLNTGRRILSWKRKGKHADYEPVALYNCNLSALRICLIALKADLHPEPSWPALQERCQNNPQIPFQILVKHRSK